VVLSAQAFPRNPNGKIDRPGLRVPYLNLFENLA
jgi:hypothetical protein